jgi:DNA-binding CsgD family transcriptional regulator
VTLETGNAYFVRAPVRARNIANSDNIVQALVDQLPDTLTAKEAEVVDLYERGMSQRSIAIFLGVGRSTVRARIANAAAKVERAQRLIGEVRAGCRPLTCVARLSLLPCDAWLVAAARHSCFVESSISACSL